MKKLAICVPTFNRAKLLDRLLKSIPSNRDIVVSICDDGSSDNTFEIIKKHKNRFEIDYLYQENKGRASALRKSILYSKANFVLIIDSDDYFINDGVEIILNEISKNKNSNFLVFSTKIKLQNNSIINSVNRLPEINYLSLRADFKIKYDLQEVVKHNLLLKVMYDDPKKIRRIPTSYLWFKLSETMDCLPINSLPVKSKEYKKDGMTYNILPLKVKYPEYLVKMYSIAINSHRYKSYVYRFKNKILFYRYSFHNDSIKNIITKDVLFILIGYLYGLIDILILSMFHNK